MNCLYLLCSTPSFSLGISIMYSSLSRVVDFQDSGRVYHVLSVANSNAASSLFTWALHAAYMQSSIFNAVSSPPSIRSLLHAAYVLNDLRLIQQPYYSCTHILLTGKNICRPFIQSPTHRDSIYNQLQYRLKLTGLFKI